jgi:hypothetical protein
MVDKPAKYTNRFNFKQLQEAILVQKDGNALF